MHDTKATNPKDLIGSDKLPLHLWPSSATATGCLALLDGALKYGRGNWRHAGVRASIYYDAQQRHMARWFEGEDTDPDSGLPHLSHALACLAIVVDAQAAGKLTDDRQTEGGFTALLAQIAPHVPRLRAAHRHRTGVRHYTIKDRPFTPSYQADERLPETDATYEDRPVTLRDAVPAALESESDWGNSVLPQPVWRVERLVPRT